jgi:CubicO group peptidase (beta-lactamase class C family)
VLADTSNKVPGGGLVGTAADAARFGAAFLGSALVSEQSRRLMTTAQSTRTGPTSSGYGFFVGRADGVREAWHEGGQPQVSNILYIQLDRRRVVALLSNLEGVGPQLRDLARAAARAIAVTPGS